MTFRYAHSANYSFYHQMSSKLTKHNRIKKIGHQIHRKHYITPNNLSLDLADWWNRNNHKKDTSSRGVTTFLAKSVVVIFLPLTKQNIIPLIAPMNLLGLMQGNFCCIIEILASLALPHDVIRLTYWRGRLFSIASATETRSPGCQMRPMNPLGESRSCHGWSSPFGDKLIL